MTASRDPERLITAFLADGPTELPDRTYDAVRYEIDRTRQRVIIGPWRFPEMNLYAKLAIVAAAVVVVAVVGVNLLPGGSVPGVGGTPVATPSGSPPPSQPSPSPTPSPSPAAAAFPPVGPLATGTHRAVLDGVPLSFALQSSGWESTGDSLLKGEYEEPDSAAINLWRSAPDNVYSDPCAHTPLSPPPSPTAAGIAAAAAEMPGIDVVAEPTVVTIDGHPAQYLAFSIRDDINCHPHAFYLWYDDSTGGASGGWRWAGALGETHRVWIIDIDGRRVWIDSETFRGAKAEADQEVQQIIDSIQFE